MGIVCRLLHHWCGLVCICINKLGNMKDIKDFQLLEYNTFGIEGKCKRFVEFDSIDELKSVLATLSDADSPLMVLGGGSNLLLTHDFSGTVLHSNIITPPSVERFADACGDIYVRAGSGMIWDDLVSFCVENGIYGSENLSLIPGTVGASAVQNIGAYGAEAKDIIHKVEAVEIATGKEVTFSNADCGYAYRHSRFKGEWKGRYRAIIRIREAKLPDPKVEGNAGSFFMNPVVSKSKYEALAAEYPGMPHYTIDSAHEKIPAGWMIDRCGWKGKSLGKAGVHDKQALVLVNRGGATGQEIVHLCNVIRQDVLSKFGIEINPEVNII